VKKENIGSFVAVSDFHSMEYPLKKVEDYYIHEYEHVYILGDVIDRGKNNDGTKGVEMLFRIMNLEKQLKNSDLGKIHYIPGNHDHFLYSYAMYDDKVARDNLIYNGGEATVKDIDYLKKNNPRKLDELLEWLGSRPVQAVHSYNGQKYTLAHAFFDMEVYQEYSDLSLSDFLPLRDYINNCNDKLQKAFFNILWFRKNKDLYDENKVPSDDYIEVIGHTPSSLSDNGKYDLINSKGKRVKVHCVDGDVVHGKDMLKYDGKKSPIITKIHEHSNTSIDDVKKPKYSYVSNNQKEKELCAKEIVLSFLIDENCFNKNVGLIQKIKNNLFLSKDISNLEKISFRLDNVRKNLGYTEEEFKEFIVETSLEYIIECQLARFSNSLSDTKGTLSCWLKKEEADYTYVTRYCGARTVSRNLDRDSVKEVFPNYNEELNRLISQVYIDLKKNSNNKSLIKSDDN